ncbi:p1/s1 nuclease, putative [Plasmodium malariae]|uniref:p1/s1 nuclease, putative n=1 Tax=Plasmodium malariae TaxID=5858 RepID=A0A1C3KFM1_PLAMA|nr:p1/s1 nuclease, putative [Plasmodium malariae]
MFCVRIMIRLVLLYGILFIKSIAGWSDEPHMIISQIAYDILTPHHQSILDRIFEKSYDDKLRSPIKAAVWPDAIKPIDPRRAPYQFTVRRNEILDIFNDWHYVKEPYNPTGIYLSPYDMYAHKGKNTASGITKHIYKTLVGVGRRNLTGTYYSYNFYLRFFIHVFGDIHQPLHTINFFNSHLTSGDKGGNLITVTFGKLVGNIHYLCDNVFNSRKKKWFNSTPQDIKKLADKLTTTYPRTLFPRQLRIPSDKVSYIDEIVSESHRLAIDYVYRQLPAPILTKCRQFPVPKHFITQLKKILNKQIAIAGYRLAEYLKDILDNVPSDL